MPSKRPTDEDAARAKALGLSAIINGFTDSDVHLELLALHPRHDTFPGELYLEMAVDVLELAAPSRDEPIEYEGLITRHLPDLKLRGRSQHEHMKYAMLTPPAWRGGLAPDLLGEVHYWVDDYWVVALDALAIYVRATAERTGRSVTDVCAWLAERHGITLPEG